MTEKDLEIQRLRQELAEKSRIIQEQGEYIAGELVPEREAKLKVELKQVKRERDAAIEDINKGKACNICKHFGKGWNDFCCNCEYNSRTHRPNFEWRGVKEAAE